MRVRVWTAEGYRWSENTPSEARPVSFSGAQIVGQSGTRTVKGDFIDRAKKGWETRKAQK